MSKHPMIKRNSTKVGLLPSSAQLSAAHTYIALHTREAVATFENGETTTFKNGEITTFEN